MVNLYLLTLLLMFVVIEKHVQTNTHFSFVTYSSPFPLR